MDPILIVIAVVVFFFFAIGMATWHERRRRQEWMVQALELDMKYQPLDDGFDRRFGSFKLFNQGRSRRAKNILRGSQRGAEVVLADYYYVTGSGKNSQTHAQTVCILRSPNINIPHCFLRRQMRFYDFLGRIFGGQDINFATDPDFSKTFVLQGRDEDATFKLFRPEVRQHFMNFRDTWIQFEGLGNTLLLHFGRTIKPQEASALLEKAFSFLNLFQREK